MDTRILIVEDNALMANELEIRLKSLGYEICAIASTGIEAIELTEKLKPSLVLMDIVLKGDMDGIKAACRIRKQFSLPVIYVTAYVDDDLLARAKITEPYGYIVKPFSERELNANIEMALYKHQADKKLRKIENWFSASMQGVADGVVVTNSVEGKINYINRVAEMMTGWLSSEAEGHITSDVYHLIDKKTRAEIEDPMSRILREGLVTDMSQETILVNESNDEIPVAYAGACLRGGDDEPTGAVLVLKDLSENKRTEGLLHEAEAALLHSQKMETVGQLAGGVAHDFNNELNVILGYVDILLQQGECDARNKKMLKEVQGAGNRAASLTRQLLIFSRKQVVEPKIISINQVIKNSEEMLCRLIGDNFTLTTDISSIQDRVKADFGQIEQVVMNLVVNARDSMPDGGSIEIRTSSVDFKEHDSSAFSGIPSGHYLLLEVSDTGCGMSPEVRAHLFEPFYTTKEAGKGTGLGLATVYGIIKQNNGYIDVVSETNVGTTVKIYMQTTSEQVPEKVSVSDSSILEGDETILFVEDNQEVRCLGVEVLEMFGYNVIDASNGEEAFDIFKQHKDEIQLIVTDVVMPGMSGQALSKKIKEIKQDAKILLLSGHTEDDVIRSGVFQNDIAFLQKPYSLPSFSQKIRGVLAS